MIAHVSDDGLNREETVAEHTQKTEFLCNKKGERCGLSQIMSLCGILHDMGKNKQKFDDYLRAEETTRQKLRGSIAHASTGAKYLYDRYHEDSGNIKFVVEVISYAVAAHHGLFDCVNAEHIDMLSKKLDKVDDYDEACHNAIKSYLKDYEIEKIFTDSCNEFDFIQNKIKELFIRLQSVLTLKNSQNVRERLSEYKLFLLSCLQRLILSILIDSDWEATVVYQNK